MTYTTDATDHASIRARAPAGKDDGRATQKVRILNALTRTLTTFDKYLPGRDPHTVIPSALLTLVNVFHNECPDSQERRVALDLIGQAFVRLERDLRTAALYVDHACARAIEAIYAPTLAQSTTPGPRVETTEPTSPPPPP